MIFFKLLRHSNYLFLNLFVLIATFVVIYVCIAIKSYNVQISEEIKYISIKIAEQQDTIKIYKAELALLTSPKSLKALYKAYYNKDEFIYKASIARIKNTEQFSAYFTPKYLSLK